MSPQILCVIVLFLFATLFVLAEAGEKHTLRQIYLIKSTVRTNNTHLIIGWWYALRMEQEWHVWNEILYAKISRFHVHARDRKEDGEKEEKELDEWISISVYFLPPRRKSEWLLKRRILYYSRHKHSYTQWMIMRKYVNSTKYQWRTIFFLLPLVSTCSSCQASNHNLSKNSQKDEKKMT